MSTPLDLKTLCAAATPGALRKCVTDAQGTCGIMHTEKRGYAVAWFSSAYCPVEGYVGEDAPVLGRPEREANAQLIARLSPEVVLAIEVFIQSTPRAHVLNPNDEGRECRCGQCERWYESRRLQRLLDGQPEARK